MAKEIKLPIRSKMLKTADGKRSFKTFTTRMNLEVEGEEEKGKQVKTITVKFVKDIDTKNIKRGYLIAKASDINAPFKYKITVDENGDKQYPVVWVRGYIKYVEQIAEHKQSDFVIDEEDTEEVELDEE